MASRWQTLAGASLVAGGFPADGGEFDVPDLGRSAESSYSSFAWGCFRECRVRSLGELLEVDAHAMAMTRVVFTRPWIYVLVNFIPKAAVELELDDDVSQLLEYEGTIKFYCNCRVSSRMAEQC